jgi:hypothetical protein
MPVTRDLSPAKRQAIVKWIQNPQGQSTGPVPSANTPQAAVPPGAGKDAKLDHSRGGKTAALAKRLGLRGKSK